MKSLTGRNSACRHDTYLTTVNAGRNWLQTFGDDLPFCITHWIFWYRTMLIPQSGTLANNKEERAVPFAFLMTLILDSCSTSACSVDGWAPLLANAFMIQCRLDVMLLPTWGLYRAQLKAWPPVVWFILYLPLLTTPPCLAWSIHATWGQPFSEPCTRRTERIYEIWTNLWNDVSIEGNF